MNYRLCLFVLCKRALGQIIHKKDKWMHSRHDLLIPRNPCTSRTLKFQGLLGNVIDNICQKHVYIITIQYDGLQFYISHFYVYFISLFKYYWG